MPTLIEEIRDEVTMTEAWVRNRVADLRGEDADRGSTTAETIIWFAVLAAAAISIGTVVVNKLTTKAEGVSLQ